MADAMNVLRALWARFSPSFDAFASGQIQVHEIVCLLCEVAPCVCGPCSNCGWNGAPGNCQACGRAAQR